MSKLVRGFGINDADYEVTLRSTDRGVRKVIWICPFYSAWSSMINRCYGSRKSTDRRSYYGCSVSQEWARFSRFREWMDAQDWHGKELDKDILIKGNRVYAPERCVFIPGGLNRFLNDRKRRDANLPSGVYWLKNARKYRAKCSNPFTGQVEHLGVFVRPEDAHEAWGERKHQIACAYADDQNDKRIATALRTRFLPSTKEEML